MVSIITLKLIKPPNTIYKWDATKTEKAFWFISYKRRENCKRQKILYNVHYQRRM